LLGRGIDADGSLGSTAVEEGRELEKADRHAGSVCARPWTPALGAVRVLGLTRMLPRARQLQSPIEGLLLVAQVGRTAENMRRLVRTFGQVPLVARTSTVETQTDESRRETES